jgi:hypothetical protein
MTEIIIEIRHTGNREFYDIFFNGDSIGCSRSPEYKACVLLSGRGITGKAAFKRLDRDQIDMRMDIETGARKYAETEKKLETLNKREKHV